ncbi:MAG: sugar kinase [Planctomycetia bacterium]|nr:sugar kinase [Planctomycetia bacterium]
MKKVATFGEIMIRVAPEGFLRFAQAMPGMVNTMFSGAEANVAVSVAHLGGESKYVTALPKHAIADACVSTLRGLGVDTSSIVRTDAGRLGIFFLESGANQRPSNVVYDREYSSIAMTPAEDYDWDTIFADCGWFHVTGITPALSKTAADAAICAVQEAKKRGLTVSSDLNFRKKLWKWDTSCTNKELAKRVMSQLLPYVDVLIANESDCADVLGIHADNTDAEMGKLDTSRYPDVARKVVKMFPNIQKVAITLRESHSASHNSWGGTLYDAVTDEAYFAPLNADGEYQPYEIRNIVDRVGGGDSFAAGLIFALNSDDMNTAPLAIRFAAAASCLAHSIYGDYNFSTCAEVKTLMNGNGSGRVQR